jgi:hypothetical protein
VIPSVELELKLYRFAESAGVAQWRAANLGTLQFAEVSVQVDALHDLHSRRFMEFRQWSSERRDWLHYDGDTRFVFNYPFEMRVTFPGRKYFESLEEQSSIPTPTVAPRDVVVTGDVQVREESSSTSVLAHEKIRPKSFVSHSSQDHKFVELRWTPSVGQKIVHS